MFLIYELDDSKEQESRVINLKINEFRLILDFSVKKRIVIHRDKEMLKSAVINNLVPEDKREIIFSTQLSDMSNDCDYLDKSGDLGQLEERIDKLELIVKKLVDYLLKNSTE